MPKLSWPELHGALTHFPVACLILACVFEIGAYVLRKPEGRLISYWMLVVAVIMSVPALVTGWITGNGMFGQVPSLPSIVVWHRAIAFTTAGIALLLLIWRTWTHDRIRDTALMGSILVVIAAAGGVSYTGYLGGQMVFGAAGAAPINQNSNSAQTIQKETSSLPGNTASISTQEILAGQQLFQSNNCLNCHVMNGAGARTGPDLTHEALHHSDIAWQIAHLKNPDQMSPGSFMPSYAKLTPDQLKALASFLVTRK